MTYERGEQLGCPDCATGEPHCCPFLYADALPEPGRTWALNHMVAVLANIITEISLSREHSGQDT